MSGNKKRLRGSSRRNVFMESLPAVEKQEGKSNKKTRIQLAKDEKEFSRSKAVVAEEEDDSSDVPFDGLSYEDARLAFDREKSPKLDDLYKKGHD
ncbi:hypothetical protein CTI12_AA527230 [Artemisia annua]|uniref:Uncharacterized protein n=1 Tax=Artemisia annua TaxID=35608 RepID=A0A2U1L5R4_ARTAN|nr:hypothetical protein CTI12_AA527230 [Artemisia annua]